MRQLQLNILLIFLLFAGVTAAQQSYITKRTNEKIELDGLQKEASWNSVQPATDFTISYPNFGVESEFRSEVKMLYDDNNLYIAAEFMIQILNLETIFFRRETM